MTDYWTHPNLSNSDMKRFKQSLNGGMQIEPERLKEKVKGEPTGKYTQRKYKGETVDLFISEHDNWGNTLMIRTGDADFSQLMMKRVLQCGYEQKDGYLWKDGKIIPVYEERQYFQLLNIPYIEPEHRDKDAFKNLK